MDSDGTCRRRVAVIFLPLTIMTVSCDCGRVHTKTNAPSASGQASAMAAPVPGCPARSVVAELVVSTAAREAVGASARLDSVTDTVAQPNLPHDDSIPDLIIGLTNFHVAPRRSVASEYQPGETSLLLSLFESTGTITAGSYPNTRGQRRKANVELRVLAIGASVKAGDVGSSGAIEITHMDDKRVCGTFDIGSPFLHAKGSFNARRHEQ